MENAVEYIKYVNDERILMGNNADKVETLHSGDSSDNVIRFKTEVKWQRLKQRASKLD